MRGGGLTFREVGDGVNVTKKCLAEAHTGILSSRTDDNVPPRM